MTSKIESSRRDYYTPLYEKQLFESRNKSMETTTLNQKWGNVRYKMFHSYNELDKKWRPEYQFLNTLTVKMSKTI